MSSLSGVDHRVLSLLVCPSCRGELEERADGLLCPAEGLVYPVHDGVPVLLPEKARKEDDSTR